MFNKTSSRIKQFISTTKEKKEREKDQESRNRRRRERDLTMNSWIPEGRKSMDETFVRRTKTKYMLQECSLLPLPSPHSVKHSSRSFCNSICNSPTKVPPHSLSGLDKSPRMPHDLCLVDSSNPVIPALLSNNLANELYETAGSTSQIGLLEALALEPIENGDENPQQESLTMSSPSPDNTVKGTTKTPHQKNQILKALKCTPTNRLTVNQESCSKQDSTSVIRMKMFPRVEPRRQYRAPFPFRVILTQPENVSPKKHEEDGVNNTSGANSIPESPPPANLPLSLTKIGKRSSDGSSQEHAQKIIGKRRSGSDSSHHLKIGNIDKNNITVSSETFRSTELTGPTLLEPFHHKDLSLRVRLAENPTSTNNPTKSVEVRGCTTSTLTVQNCVHTCIFEPFAADLEVRKAQYTSLSRHEVVLKSTNFSLTSPGYRHGDIRVRRRPQNATQSRTSGSNRPIVDISSLNRDQAERRSILFQGREGEVDGEMDLQEFQIAIIGATSHHWIHEYEICLNDSPHSRPEDHEVELDELGKWCDEFGIDTGKVVRGHHLREEELQEKLGWVQRQMLSQVSKEMLIDNFSTVSDPPREDLNMRNYSKSHGGNFFSPPLHEATGLEREDGIRGGRNGIGKVSHSGDASLPPSPMQNICPSSLERPESFVPMGFNVDHDLRDYLKWNSDCVNGSIEGE